MHRTAWAPTQLLAKRFKTEWIFRLFRFLAPRGTPPRPLRRTLQRKDFDARPQQRCDPSVFRTRRAVRIELEAARPSQFCFPIVAGGTPSDVSQFTAHLWARAKCSPGTCLLWDRGLQLQACLTWIFSCPGHPRFVTQWSTNLAQHRLFCWSIWVTKRLLRKKTRPPPEFHFFGLP